MSDEPRRSGRATKGQHKNASSSPAPTAKQPAKTAKSKPPKKSLEPEPQEGDDDEVIRCICGNSNPKDKRAFIGCDACTVWQHNVCVGIPEDEDEVPDHYFCEECQPGDHQETLQAIERGEKIWETRTRIHQNEKKMSKSRKNKPDYRPAWLKKDPPPEPAAPAAATPTPPAAQKAPASPKGPAAATNGGQEAGSKRKREEDPKEEEPQAAPIDKTTRSGRQDKRRKSSAIDTKILEDTETALVDMAKLSKDRQSVATALSKIISADIEKRVKSGLELPAAQTPASIAEHHALRIEYALHMNIGAGQPNYKQQFMALNANLKKNTVLIERLLDASLTADELSTMSSSDMASEELQRERAQMKEALDRQAIAIEAEGPKYKQDHKGFHLIEDASEPARNEPPPESQEDKHPTPRESSSTQAQAPSASPVQSNPPPLTVDTKSVEGGHERRPSSSQQFDMNNIWAKTATAQSPTASAPTGARPVQVPVRRQSSMQAQQQNGTKDDADVDRLLDDDDDSYTPADAFGDDTVVWQGKLVQTTEDEAPVVNARFVAGRDLQPGVSWRKLLPDRLSIDGRLAIDKAEGYLCGLRWSSTSDVSVLALTAHNDAAAFDQVFKYFRTRERYAVVEKDKPAMIKDLYIVPVDVGAEKLPDHIGMLEHCTIKTPVEEKLLLATFVVARSPDSPIVQQDGTPSHQPVAPNGNGHLPQHMRSSNGGPAGSPLNRQNPTFSPANSAPPQSPYGPVPGGNAFPPNPYGPPQVAPAQQVPAYPAPTQPPGPYSIPHAPGLAPASNNPQVVEILGELATTPTAQILLRESPNIDANALTNIRKILIEDQNARTDFEAFTKKLYASG